MEPLGQICSLWDGTFGSGNDFLYRASLAEKILANLWTYPLHSFNAASVECNMDFSILEFNLNDLKVKIFISL